MSDLCATLEIPNYSITSRYAFPVEAGVFDFVKEIEADLEAKTGNEDLDDPIPSHDELGGESTAPWKTIVSDDVTIR